jgi:hypothetical protein
LLNLYFFLCRIKQTKTSDEFNPYSGRQMRLLELELDKIQAEADSYTNAPPNIVRTVWERFVEFRKRRNELEREVSKKRLSFNQYKTSIIN